MNRERPKLRIGDVFRSPTTGAEYVVISKRMIGSRMHAFAVVIKAGLSTFDMELVHIEKIEGFLGRTIDTIVRRGDLAAAVKGCFEMELASVNAQNFCHHARAREDLTRDAAKWRKRRLTLDALRIRLGGPFASAARASTLTEARLRVLRSIALGLGDVVPLATIATRSGRSVATCHEVLAELVRQHLVEQPAGHGGGYRITDAGLEALPGLTVLFDAAGIDIQKPIPVLGRFDGRAITPNTPNTPNQGAPRWTQTA